MTLTELIWEIKRFGFENIFRKYYSTYTAQVVDNVDPEDRGRLKLLVPDILDDKELAEWAEPQLTTGGQDSDIEGSGTDGKFGTFFPSKIGDFVWVEFRMGDLRNPVYRSGGWWADGEKPDFLSDDRKNAIFISRFGHKITVDETEGAAKILVETNKGSKFEIDDTDEAEKITMLAGLSGNKIEFFDKADEEYILIQDKAGDSWKWDLAEAKWTIIFNGDKEETVNGTLTQTVTDNVIKSFNKNLTITVTDLTTLTSDITFIESLTSAVLKQPQIAIGNGTVELLEQILNELKELQALCVELSTEVHIGNLAQATSVPVNAGSYLGVKAKLGIIEGKIASIKGGF